MFDDDEKLTVRMDAPRMRREDFKVELHWRIPISAASPEQAADVAQVGEAVKQIDQATQQNAALVE